MEPNIAGYRIDVGDEVGDDVPDCCGDEMIRSGVKPGGHHDWACPCCKTTVVVDELGCVDAITV